MNDVIVIGGGQAGLAAGYHLKQSGLTFTILEASAQPAGSWPHYYDSLKLFSPARYSSLPGLPFPGDSERYPLRDEVIAYLTAYAAHLNLPITTNTRVQEVRRQDNTFYLTTTSGTVYQARSVIAATGSFSRPALPRLFGQESFMGKIIHAASYKQPAPYSGKRVVVVGAGNSAVQIAAELAQTATVILATHTPINFTEQRILGRDIHFWFKVTGFDKLPIPSRTGRKKSAKGPRVLDTGVYRAAIEAGKPEHRVMFTRFTPYGVVWADGTPEQVDAVIFATGYQPNLDFLSGLGALDDDGQAIHKAGISVVPGVYFVGLSGQRSFSSATLRGVGADANYVIAHLGRYLRQIQQQQAFLTLVEGKQ